MVTSSIPVCKLGVYPPPKNPFILFEKPLMYPFPTVKFPKSVALPAEVAVINSIVSVYPEGCSYPPAAITLVKFAAAPLFLLVTVQSPKSVALPKLA